MRKVIICDGDRQTDRLEKDVNTVIEIPIAYKRYLKKITSIQIKPKPKPKPNYILNRRSHKNTHAHVHMKIKKTAQI